MADHPSFDIGNWDERASVRARPNPLNHPDTWQSELSDCYWYPPNMLPYLSHPHFSNVSRETIIELTAKHLIYFLDYTVKLEHLIVNRSVETILYDALGVKIPGSMKTAALQLYTDEGYHALFSHQLAEKVSSIYGYQGFTKPPHRITQLYKLLRNTNSAQVHLTHFVIGFVSETLIAKELADLTQHKLVGIVSNMFREHLIDEANHSRFFSSAFIYVWKRCKPKAKAYIAHILPSVLDIFVSVDSLWLSGILKEARVGAVDTTTIIQSMNDASATRERIRLNAQATFATLRRSGMLLESPYCDVFVEEGLHEF